MSENENLDQGFVKIYRSIQDNWIWADANKLKWWLDILMEVNYKDKTVNFGGVNIECKRGQCLYSLETWARRWRVDKSKVRRFLYLLQDDKMVVLENVLKTTRLTVCKYDSYNELQNADETQVKRKRNASETRVKPTKEGEERQESKEAFRENIFLLPAEHAKLIEKIGEQHTDACYNFLSSYKIEKKYNTQSDYLTILRWVIDAVAKQQGQQEKNGTINPLKVVIPVDHHEYIFGYNRKTS